jgi:NTP pyrophosphatase (non-canonical NTP hydrolase)
MLGHIDKDKFEDYVNTCWHNHNSGDAAKDLAVVSLGLGGETGEVLEHLKKHIRDGKIDRHELELELGDVLHYLIRIANHYNLTLDSVMSSHVEKMEKKYGVFYSTSA